MARKESRVSKQFLEDQKGRRKTLEDAGPNYGQNVPELRERVTALERITGIRSE